MREVAVGIIMRNGHVLACQRKRTAKYALKWEFPGGKLENGETPRHALLRELREELAIEAKEVEDFFLQEWVYKEPPGSAQRDGMFRVFYFIVTSFVGQPQNHAFEQVCWIRPHELQSMDILEGNREAVERLVKHVEAEQTT